MGSSLHFSKRCAYMVGNILGVNWRKIDFNQFYMGINVELEHGSRFGYITNVTNNDPVTTGRIALAHIFEIPDYYTRLEKMERKAEKKKKH
jgi:hypothetical protein